MIIEPLEMAIPKIICAPQLKLLEKNYEKVDDIINQE